MLGRTFAALCGLLGAIARDRRGVTAVFVAVSLVPIVGAVGLAVDSSIGYLLRTRMAKSLDAAGLAAGRVALDDDAEAVARQFFDANFGESTERITVTDFDFAFDTAANTVTLSAEATTPTVFMRVFGHDQMTVAAETVIQRRTSGMELALILDNTGSMYGTNFNNMKAGADTLINIVFGEKNEVDNVWVSVVPFVATVNIGPTRTGWLAAGDKAVTTPSAFGTAVDGTGWGWKGCVMARAYPWDTDDSTPVDASVQLVPLSEGDRQQLAADRRRLDVEQRGAKGSEPRVRHADHAAHRVAGHGPGRARCDALVAARRHDRQPRAGLGVADALAEVARAVGRRRTCRSTTMSTAARTTPWTRSPSS